MCVFIPMCTYSVYSACNKWVDWVNYRVPQTNCIAIKRFSSLLPLRFTLDVYNFQVATKLPPFQTRFSFYYNNNISIHKGFSFFGYFPKQIFFPLLYFKKIFFSK